MKTKHCIHLYGDDCAYCRLPEEVVQIVGMDNLPDFIHSMYLNEKKPYGGKCKDCKGKNDAYMVRDSIWKQAHNSRKSSGYLCLSCLETRLGRDLTLRDFTKCPLNYAWKRFDCREFIRRKIALQS